MIHAFNTHCCRGSRSNSLWFCVCFFNQNKSKVKDVLLFVCSHRQLIILFGAWRLAFDFPGSLMTRIARETLISLNPFAKSFSTEAKAHNIGSIWIIWRTASSETLAFHFHLQMITSLEIWNLWPDLCLLCVLLTYHSYQKKKIEILTWR
jgi:MFS superfamily sulfate permease-like transporter